MKDEMIIDGEIWVKKESSSEKSTLPYVLIRGNRSGIFTGYLKEKNGIEVILLNARRIWHWEGAATISQLSIDGVSDPKNCRFPQEVSAIKILDVIEILDVTEKARKSIKNVEIWKF